MRLVYRWLFGCAILLAVVFSLMFGLALVVLLALLAVPLVLLSRMRMKQRWEQTEQPHSSHVIDVEYEEVESDDTRDSSH
jgi:1,4-dihydroxy-2-naphthoate octaprenyltransferase